MENLYTVQIEKFAKTHFIKNFQKKYKRKWDVTLNSIIGELKRIDNFLKTDRTKVIVDSEFIKIIKTSFRVAGTKYSAKKSGNRCIAALDTKNQTASILLVYGKTNLSGSNETARWQKIIKNNYPEYRDLF